MPASHRGVTTVTLRSRRSTLERASESVDRLFASTSAETRICGDEKDQRVYQVALFNRTQHRELHSSYHISLKYS